MQTRQLSDEWSCMQAFLESLALTKYASAFEKEEIDLFVLPEMTERHLMELGISIGARIKLAAALKPYRANVD